MYSLQNWHTFFAHSLQFQLGRKSTYSLHASLNTTQLLYFNFAYSFQILEYSL